MTPVHHPYSTVFRLPGDSLCIEAESPRRMLVCLGNGMRIWGKWTLDVFCGNMEVYGFSFFFFFFLFCLF